MRLTLLDVCCLSDVDLLTTATLWASIQPRSRLDRRIQDEIVTLTMEELRSRSSGLKPHRNVTEYTPDNG